MTAGYDGSIKIDTSVNTTGMTVGCAAVKASLAAVTGSAQGMAAALVAAFAPMAAIAAITAIVMALFRFGKAAVGVASDLEEVQNVVDVTFGKMSSTINDFADTAITKFGLSELAAKKYASTMGAMFKSMGFGTSTAAEMSTTMAGLAGDMASFYNLDTETAFQKLRSGISGETEPLKQLGINLSEANLQAFAAAKGYKTAYNQMSELGKATMRYEYILHATSAAQGDFARTSGNWANQTRILKEQWSALLGEMGKGLVQLLTPILRVINEVLAGLILVVKAVNTLLHITDDATASADALADSENGVAEGIDNAAKAAKNALAAFDDLDVLQQDMGSGGFGSFDITPSSESNGKLGDDATKNKYPVALTPDITGWPPMLDPVLVRAELMTDPVFLNLPQTAEDWGLVPPLVPAPDFSPIQNPVYTPDWNLVPPFVPAPIFAPLPNPVYIPEWNLAKSFEPEMVRLGELFETMRENASQSVATMTSNCLNNLAIFGRGAATVYASFAAGFSKAVGDAMQSAMDNTALGLNNMYTNTYAWATGSLKAAEAWGNGMIEAAAQTAQGMRDGFVSGLRSMWDSFLDFAQATGKAVSGFWTENQDVIIKSTLIGIAVVGAAAAIALTAGVAAPAIAAAAGAVATAAPLLVPALATGAVIPPNSEFLAVLGDQKSGRNFEAPEGLLRQIVREEAGGQAGGDLTVNMPVYLDNQKIYEGQKKIAWKRGTSLIEEEA